MANPVFYKYLPAFKRHKYLLISILYLLIFVLWSYSFPTYLPPLYFDVPKIHRKVDKLFCIRRRIRTQDENSRTEVPDGIPAFTDSLLRSQAVELHLYSRTEANVF